MYFQGLLCIYKVCYETEKDCHCGETNCTGYNPDTLVQPENYHEQYVKLKFTPGYLIDVFTRSAMYLQGPL